MQGGFVSEFFEFELRIDVMPKMKTNCSAKKRFKKTASGKFKREKAYNAHILTKKSRKRKRNLRTATVVAESNHKYVLRLLPGV